MLMILSAAEAQFLLLKDDAAAGRRYLAGAYLHAYAAHGIERDDFKAAFEAVGETVRQYDRLQRETFCAQPTPLGSDAGN